MHIKTYIDDHVIPEVNEGGDAQKEVKDLLAVMHNVVDDAYIIRGNFFGLASANENQYNYLTNNFGRNLENRLNRLAGTGVLSESNIDEYKFANEEKPHMNEDVTLADQIAEVQQMIDRNNEKRHLCAMWFYFCKLEHDQVSFTLQQLTYSAIRAKAAEKTAARAAA